MKHSGGCVRVLVISGEVQYMGNTQVCFECAINKWRTGRRDDEELRDGDRQERTKKWISPRQADRPEIRASP